MLKVSYSWRWASAAMVSNTRDDLPGHAGEDGDFALGNAQRDVFEVVFTRAADLDIFLSFVLGHTYLLTSSLGQVIGEFFQRLHGADNCTVFYCLFALGGRGEEQL